MIHHNDTDILAAREKLIFYPFFLSFFLLPQIFNYALEIHLIVDFIIVVVTRM